MTTDSPPTGDATATGSDGRVPTGRSARKRQAIADVALALFLRNGYRDTSMDQVAADAGVSKQTVYKHFADKERLFTDIVLGVTRNSDQIVAELTATLDADRVESADDLATAMERLARAYLEAVLQPHVLALRRLIIAEAERFPELARRYYESAPARGISTIADALQTFADRGLITAGDVLLAAGQFAYLALGIVQDKAHFCPAEPPSPAERDAIAAAAARVFLAAYRNDAAPRRSGRTGPSAGKPKTGRSRSR
ncbi:TetR/AcrR family transcriptional regulator [Actinopolymorpha sp. NPDC004070]|uniref:TetR/AcrR family transcriptional regulator n=1 Tax=Actinopolymorpha sp. NPDC004070 TaxID=3154548 RepID=UPI0033B9B732